MTLSTAVVHKVFVVKKDVSSPGQDITWVVSVVRTAVIMVIRSPFYCRTEPLLIQLCADSLGFLEGFEQKVCTWL